MPSNTIASAENDFQSRISRLTSVEVQWIDSLKKSELDLSTPFTSKQAVEAIKQVPLNSGKERKIVPNQIKFVYIMKKSGVFEEVSRMLYSKCKPKRWRLRV